MTTYQKIAILVIRLFAIGLILYTSIAAVPAAIMMPKAVWIMLPSLIGGAIIYLVSVPLGHLITRGFED